MPDHDAFFDKVARAHPDELDALIRRFALDRGGSVDAAGYVVVDQDVMTIIVDGINAAVIRREQADSQKATRH